MINLGIAVLLVSGIIYGVIQYLDHYTLHGQSITVPDLRGYKIDELEVILKEKKLSYIITDSVHNHKMPKGTVVDQNPIEGSQVKENRKIYLTVNAIKPEQVTLPVLKDLSRRRAEPILESKGLKVGQIIFEPSENSGVVIRIEKDGKELKPGEKIDKLSVVDIVLGQEGKGELVSVPNLIGMTLEAADVELRKKILNRIEVEYTICKDAGDTMNAKIIKQDPDFFENALIHQGKTINLWLSCRDSLATDSIRKSSN